MWRTKYLTVELQEIEWDCLKLSEKKEAQDMRLLLVLWDFIDYKKPSSFISSPISLSCFSKNAEKSGPKL